MNPLSKRTAMLEVAGGGKAPKLEIIFQTTEDMNAASDYLRDSTPEPEPRPFLEWAADIRTQSMQAEIRAYREKVTALEARAAHEPCNEPERLCKCVPLAPRNWSYCQDCGGRIAGEDRGDHSVPPPCELRQLVAQQAEDDGLWFNAVTAGEAYLQQELRKLHAAIEGERIEFKRTSPPPGVAQQVYPCGCSASPDDQVPNYCPTHGRPAAEALYWQWFNSLTPSARRFDLKLDAFCEGWDARGKQSPSQQPPVDDVSFVSYGIRKYGQRFVDALEGLK